ncbi:cytochrome P450 [Leekyejoonella antrihumi]|uniref:Cytochrome P450 n=1 Tax=Leekyejoonella antrihumi TaxID=1660198 RepID=A0A563DYY6_9MICO|nr:cytochrome P450 [Leekyejoonella antrihumi]TWP35211.1 cytochrome P450 [Leekyejoonella antrihumi]
MPRNWAHSQLPHPPGRRPVIGDLATIFRGDTRKPVQNALRTSGPLGPIYEIKVFRGKVVIVRDAELAAELCDESRFEKKLAPGVQALRETAGDGLFTAYTHEPNWRLAHDLLRPAFTREAMKGYHQTMVDAADELIALWDRSDRPVPVSPNLTKLTLETIGRTSFSKDFGSFSRDGQDPFVPAMARCLKRGQVRGAFAALPFGGALLRRGRQPYLDAKAYIDALIDDIIAERLASHDTSQEDLLGLMLHAAHEETGDHLDRLNIRRQIITFLVAGHETTSGALSFAMYYLATNPQVRAKAAQEADAILGPDPDSVPTFEQVAKFRYIRRVLDESLRLWPTAPGFARGPVKDTVLAGRYPMTTDDWCIVMSLAVHRDPKVWGDDPDTFDPDRFLPAAVRARPAHTYFPFGTGERSCIGRQFALHEAVLLLARACHRYDFAADPAYQLDIAERLTLMPDGFDLTMVRRTPRRQSEPLEMDQASRTA